MTNILILGGYGYTGRLLAKHLLAQTDTGIVLAGRNIKNAEFIADQFRDDRVSCVYMDASEPDSMIAALQNVDMMLVAAPTTQHTKKVARAALDAKVDYLDVQYSSKKIAVLNELASEIKQAGLCFVTEAGYHPGLPSAMVRYAAAQMDEIHSGVTAGYLNMGKDLPYSEAVDELVEGFIDFQAQVFTDGAWTGPKKWVVRKFNFGEEIGVRTCYSMFFEELRDLPEIYPSLQETGFYISGSNWLTDIMITPIVMLGLKLAPKQLMSPLGKLMWWGMQQSPPPYKVALSVEASGMKKGQRVRIRAQIEHTDGYELTAIPVTAYLEQYLDSSAREPGLHMMGHIIEPIRLFEDMQKMGVQIIEEIQ